MDNEKNFSSKVGQFIANVFVACIATCLAACAIAATVRFIAWLF